MGESAHRHSADSVLSSPSDSGFTVQHRMRFGLASLVVLAACQNSTEPAQLSIPGSYTATSFTAVTADTVFNLLDEGVSVTITLKPDGSTAGTQIGDGVATDLTGTWDTSGSRLHLHLQQPSGLARIEFMIAPDTLEGDLPFDTARLHLTLTK